MNERISEITLAVEGTVTITTAEYCELIGCQTMLDLILASSRKDTNYGYADNNLLKLTNRRRQLHNSFPFAPPNLEKPKETKKPEERDGDA